MTSVPRPDLLPVLPCFFDIPVQEASKMLRLSSHTMLKLRKAQGLARWPYEQVRKGEFQMNWRQIDKARKDMMVLVKDEELLSALRAAERRGWLLRTIHEPKPQCVQEITDWGFLDKYFGPDREPDEEPIPELEEPSPASHAASEENPEDERPFSERGLFDDLSPFDPDSDQGCLARAFDPDF